MDAAKPSMDSRIVGEDAREELELEKRIWPRSEKVGVTGEWLSDDVDENE